MNQSPALLTRRAFGRATLAGVGAAAAMPAIELLAAAPPASKGYCAFIKFLTSFGYDQLSDRIAELGFGGVEATVRRGGYIEPAQATQELPKFRKALDRNKLELTIVTTDILSVDDPHADSLLRAAADAGARRYRLGFYNYDSRRRIVEQIEALRPQFAKLADFSRQISLPGMYQNHSGQECFGATLWDLYYVLRSLPPEDLGCVYDLRHATVEAGEAWPMLHQVMQPHIVAYSVKDFDWGDEKSRNVPLGEGRVDRKFYAELAKSDFSGPISLHVEYLHDGDADANLAALKQDLATLREWMS